MRPGGDATDTSATPHTLVSRVQGQRDGGDPRGPAAHHHGVGRVRSLHERALRAGRGPAPRLRHRLPAVLRVLLAALLDRARRNGARQSDRLQLHAGLSRGEWMSRTMVDKER